MRRDREIPSHSAELTGLPARWRALRRGLSILTCWGALVTSLHAASSRIDFGRDVRPILSDNCFTCHGPDQEKRKAGLRLDLKEEAFKKLKSGGSVILPGKPEESRLIQVITLPDDEDDHMPPLKTGKKLSPQQIATLRDWIRDGATWSEHWAYVAPQRPAVPPAQDKALVRNEIDHFIAARLKQQGLELNAEADRYTLIRRLSLDLTGLPPSLEEVDAFVADTRPGAYERCVDRLLASPHFGERLALAWLDQARYADTSGYHFDGFRQMHLWRDWVIQAFNQNKPFDQFTIEQLAGDLLPSPTVDQKIATGFHRNVMTTDEGGVDPEEYMAKYSVDRVSTTAQVWLGTTMGCAECHDHKYDPITQREFYQMFAFFHNISERGLDGTRVRNPGPVVKAPTADQGSRLVQLLDSIPAAEKLLAQRETELPKAQEAWEQTIRSKPATRVAQDGLLTISSPGSPSIKLHGPIESLPGRLGTSWRFRGNTNDFVELTEPPSWDLTNRFSYGGWMKPETESGTLISKMEVGPGYRGFDLLLSAGRAEIHLVSVFPTNAIKISVKAKVAIQRWQHLLVTYDGSSKAAGLKVYLDGVAQAVDVIHDTLSGSIQSSAPLRIGTRQEMLAFSGQIEDLRLYERTLTAEEIASIASERWNTVARLAASDRSAEETEALRTYFRERHNPAWRAATDQLATLRRQKEELLGRIPDSMVMDEMTPPRDTFILVRGNYQSQGAKVSAGIPACWPPLPTDQPTNRLALARWIVSPGNPLTARVTVNRYWALFFGTGLVKTSNDFGSQGDAPSHPELLDWLASEFMEPTAQPAAAHRWDIQHILRLIVSSAAYRQSAVVSKEKLEKDPYNRLISRGPRNRLDAELVRDNALAISGLLDRRIGGPSVKPYQPPGIWEVTDHQYEQSHGIDLYRRGMYVFWKRAAHYPSFQIFDAPSRETCTLLRPRTSTPLQSLVMMNDPVYVEAARGLAQRVIESHPDELQKQLNLAFRLAVARPPTGSELETLHDAYKKQLARFSAEPQSADELLGIGESPRAKTIPNPSLAAMTGVANVLLNLNETLTR